MVLYAAIVVIIAMMIILSIKSKKAVVTVVIDEVQFELTVDGSKEAINSIVFVDIASVLADAESIYETLQEELELRDQVRDKKRGEHFGMGHCAHCRREHRSNSCGGRGAQKYKAKK